MTPGAQYEARPGDEQSYAAVGNANSVHFGKRRGRQVDGTSAADPHKLAGAEVLDRGVIKTARRPKR
jgi:hypothetical protein